MRTEIDLRLGDLAAAEQRARKILALNPRSGLGHSLLGDVANARGQRDAAVAAYRKAHEIDRSTDSLMRLFSALARRDPPAAVRLAELWLEGKPDDAMVRRALADTQLAGADLRGARRNYEQLIQRQPGDSDALNNLANVMLLQNDAGALKVAEQALALAPGKAHIIGTTGWAAFKAGQVDRAVQLLRDARLRDPGNADTRFFLATVLVSQGRKAEARDELLAVAQDKQPSSYRTEAEKLLATLR